MKFITFERNGTESVGLIEPASERVTPIKVADMLALIGHDGEFGRGEPICLSEVRLLAPIPRPARNLFCVGRNYHEHAKEFAASGYEAGATTGVQLDEYPAVFTKPASCVVGSDAVVDLHSNVTKAVDYEGELAVIIGRGGRDIAVDDAMSHVWGYTIVNDVTARDRQKNHRQWFLGKALDTFCPMGPWIATADEVDARDLTLKTWVNGELRQDANTADLVFDIPHLIESISAGLTLQPGDIIATGTPAGVGIGFHPPRFLEPGDKVEIEITNLGRLNNRFQ
jgi:2-keto-4-pentenoate hydratase/2-oxohepta-3-ene-1,7-dioic acid hydratase in catechol pathway